MCMYMYIDYIYVPLGKSQHLCACAKLPKPSKFLTKRGPSDRTYAHAHSHTNTYTHIHTNTHTSHTHTYKHTHLSTVEVDQLQQRVAQQLSQ